MGALSNLSNRANETATADEKTLWDFMDELTDAVQEYNVLLGGNYYLATVCGNSPEGASCVIIYYFKSAECIVDVVRKFFEDRKDCSCSEGSANDSIFFKVSCGQDSCIVRLKPADEVAGFDTIYRKILVPDYLMAHELSFIGETPVVDERVITRMCNAINNRKFTRIVVQRLIRINLTNDGDIYRNIVEAFMKHYTNGSCPEQDDKIIRIIGFVSDIMYKFVIWK